MKNKTMLREDALKGQTIIVTGGGTGLGKAMSRCFLQLGADVIIASRKKEVIDVTATELAAETGGNIHAVVCDVRKYEQVENLLAESLSRFGQVTGLVNNAAGNFISPTERLSHKAFDVVVDIVLKGTYNCSLALGKYWIENKIQGTVLNIVATYAFTGSGAYVAPSACGKAGVLALTRSLAAEWGRYKIRNNAIAPGPFPTKGAWDRLYPEQVQPYINPISRIPLGRAGNHEEIANLASYLMSDFSAYMNGEVVVIDGGEWVHGSGLFGSLDNVPPGVWDELEKNRKR